MNSTGSLMDNKNNSRIESAKEIWKPDDSLKISYPLYLLGLLIIIAVYFGPFLYFRIYKKKNLNHTPIGVKHAI